MEEEELIIKGFTDCVYFLASPLTCKKGIECEYRHCEVARLNPRDCWYWLGGCCYNPECAFRHPPLDGLKEAYHEPPNLNNGPALPVDKTNVPVPCYYYLKGFCGKGDNCSFLHGPTNEVPREKKSYAATNTGSKPVKTHPDPLESAKTEHTHPEKSEPVKSKENVKHVAVYVQSEEDIEDEEFVESEENVKREEFVQSESDVFDDQSSDVFDVLVDGGSERLGYEKDADYYTDYYSDYNPVCTKSENAVTEHRSDVYDRFDNKTSEQPRESIFYRLSFQKRNSKPEPFFKRRRRSDLREFLKRKVVDDSNHRKRHVPRVGISEVVYMNKHRPPIRDKRLMKPARRSNRRSRDESGVFTGPKSLDQIKEEKKALQGSFNVTESDGFQGPRPLSEILKNKRKLMIIEN